MAGKPWAIRETKDTPRVSEERDGNRLADQVFWWCLSMYYTSSFKEFNDYNDEKQPNNI